MLKETCLELHRSVGESKPIGDLLFRDFFCPAISFAHLYGIIVNSSEQEHSVLAGISNLLLATHFHREQAQYNVSELRDNMDELLEMVAHFPIPHKSSNKKKK